MFLDRRTPYTRHILSWWKSDFMGNLNFSSQLSKNKSVFWQFEDGNFG